MGSDDKEETGPHPLDDSDAISNMEKVSPNPLKRALDEPEDLQNKKKKDDSDGYEGWSDSTVDSGCELVLDRTTLVVHNLPKNVTHEEVESFFGGNVIAELTEISDKDDVFLYVRAHLEFGSEKEADEAREKFQRSLFGEGESAKPLLIQTGGNSKKVICLSGLDTTVPVSKLERRIGKCVQNFSYAFKIFLPKHPETGDILGVAYALISMDGVDPAIFPMDMDMGGKSVRIRLASLKSLFEDEVDLLASREAPAVVTSRESEKLASKKTLLPYKLGEKIIGKAGMNFNWKGDRKDIIPVSIKQKQSECWTIPLVHSYRALMKLNGKEVDESLTSEYLQKVVDPAVSLAWKGLPNIKQAIPVMVPKYVSAMIVHHRPRSADFSEHEAFEKEILSLLGKCPVMVCIEVLDSYSRFSGKGLYIPSLQDTYARTFENLPYHSLFLTGDGYYDGLDHTWR